MTTIHTPEFYDRFVPGRSFLYLRFIEFRKAKKVLAGKTKDGKEEEESYLAMRDAVGVYQGRNGSIVRLAVSGDAHIAVRAEDIRGVKEFCEVQLRNIMDSVAAIVRALEGDHGDPCMALANAINGLRDVNERESIFLPRLKACA